jgi:hypothetical protein
MDLKVDKDLEAHLPVVDDDSTLDASLLASGGALDTIKVQKGTGVIVDGHRRYKRCLKLGLPYKVEEIPVSDPKQWMTDWQLSRRNMTNVDAASLVKGAVPAEHGKIGPATESVAKKMGVSTRTVHRKKKTGEALEKLHPDVRKKIKSHAIAATATDVANLSEFSKEDQLNVIADFETGEYPTLKACIEGDADTVPANKPKPNKVPKLKKDGLTHIYKVVRILQELGLYDDWIVPLSKLCEELTP